MQQPNYRPGPLSPLVPSHVPSIGGLENEDISFKQAFRVLRKRKYLVVMLTLGGALFALAMSFALRPYYKTKALIEIEKQQSDPMAGALGQLAGSLGGTDDAKIEQQTQVSILQSDALAIETMQQTDFLARRKHGLWERLEDKVWPGQKGQGPSQEAYDREALLSDFQKRLIVTPIPDTRLIEVSFEDPDPDFAALLANGLLMQYVHDRLGRRNSKTIQASEWMSNQIADLNKQVEAAQQRLIAYQRQSGLIVSPASSSNSTQMGGAPTVSSPVLDRLSQLNKDLVTAREVRITREAIYMLAKSGDADALANMTTGPSVSAPGDTAQSTGFNGLLALRQQQVALKLQLTSVLRSYGPKNPHIVELEDQLSELTLQIEQETQRIVRGAGLDYQVALKAEGGIQKAYDGEQQEAYKVNDSQIHLAVLQQEADSSRALYEDLFTKLQESKLSVGTQASNVSVINSALRPGEPAHPKKLLNAGIGLGVGLFFGVVMAFVLDNVDDSIDTSAQVEELTAVPVLGLIPQFDSSVRSNRRRGDLPEKEAAILAGARVSTKPTSEAAEAYRVLRTAILLSQSGSAPRTILVASSLPKEGKSTTTYNLAACFANLGTRVLALDADLRKPSLHKISGISNVGGLSNLLTASLDISEFIVPDPLVKNLHLLTAGPTPPNPAELLGSDSFERLLKFLSKQFDLVLIDSPPALLVADSAIMSGKVDGTLVILRAGVTTRPVVTRVAEIFHRNRANMLGFVLNAVNTKSPEYYYSYGYQSDAYYEAKGK